METKSAMFVKLATLTSLALVSTAGIGTAQAADPTTLTLSATGHAHGTPTLLTANLTAQSNAATAAEAQVRVNALTSAASKKAASIEGLHLSLRDYNVEQSETRNGQTRWTARQTLVLSGTNAEKLLQLTSAYQAQGLALSNLSWSLDPATREKLERQARTDALHRLKQDADDSAAALGLHVSGFRTIHLDPQYIRPPIVMMARMAADAPQRSADDAEDVSITARAEVYLSAP
ncbi:SIMPL domain-containing protein [Kozakia baliensis]|nr:SIMPL domain-containing protein [Kozakia baliensis]GBR31727.1 hypothetical protein AA0488_2363 [Kozakia baliensis NRIC 0488]